MKTDLSGIKNIIFDLGNVILNLDFDASVKAFQELGLDKAVLDRRQAYADPVFYNFEIGRITTAEFYDRVRQILNNPDVSDWLIDDAWYAMIGDIPARRVEVLQKLAKKYRLFLFSNTNAIHIDRLHAEFSKNYEIEFSSLFEKDFYSHEIHARKPDLPAFEKVIELAGIHPGETLFVDDLEKNCIAAAKTGFRTLWLKDGVEMAELF